MPYTLGRGWQLNHHRKGNKMKIEIIGIGEGVQKHVKELEKILNKAAGTDRGKAKLLVKELINQSRELNIDPRDVASVLLETAALMVSCIESDDESGRKNFKKQSGIAYDRALKLHELVSREKNESAAN